jgi:asparagine synthase (glutamine-hydrolysing)
MCGIAGIFNYHSPTEMPSEMNVKNMLSMINHRGPDESGVYQDKNLCIGSVRLSIVDLASGQQPMSDDSGRYWIVYNGEIFNYPELKAEMQKKGIRFRTNCDTEIVVQMYAHYGADCLNKFNGQFAFCIWDKYKKELFLARDRVGIRPLFYWRKNDSFAFCSEIKGLFTLDGIERQLNKESLSQIFSFWTTISPNTPFENIYELPPGHYMHVSSSGASVMKFWELDFSRNETETNFADTLEEFDDLLHNAVKIRLRADVPVGAYLSGGLDSSVTTAFIKDIFPGILNTYSIGFADKIFDETEYQLEVSKFLDTNHSAFTCSTTDIIANFEKTIWHTEFPLLRTSPTPMYLLSKKVRESNIKVVITGEGADEILAGYNIFKETKIRRFWANEPNSTARPKLLAKLYPYMPMMKESPDFALKMFFGYKLGETENPLYSHLLRWNNTSRIGTFFNEGYFHAQNGETDKLITGKLPVNFNKWSSLAKSQFLESTIFMSGYLLSSQGDRVAMGNSVEGRYPFLDYRLIEFCSKLPDNYKLNSLNEKFILKKLSQGRIPESITKRSKQAYRAPISDSFCNADAPPEIKEILSTDTLIDFGIFNHDKVNRLISNINQQKNISEIDQMAITGIVSTQLLQKMFVKNTLTPDVSRLNNYRFIKEY